MLEIARMNVADLLIVAVLVVSVVSAFVKGFFVEVFSLVGVFVGLFLAAAKYGEAATLIERVINNRQVANLIAFVSIALLVMLLFGLLGRGLRGLVRTVGLGIVDRLFGAAFGFVKGSVIVTLVLMGVVAFLPRQGWLASSRFAPMFLATARGGLGGMPVVLGQEIRQGLDALKSTQTNWFKRGSMIE